MIVKLTKLDKMTVSKALKKLVDRELVKREEDQTDTRAKTVTLSHKGKALINKLVPIVEKNDKIIIRLSKVAYSKLDPIDPIIPVELSYIKE